LLVVGLDGRTHAGAAGALPSSELPMHLEVYRQRPDVTAAIHAHPVFATVLTMTRQDFPADVLPEVLATLGTIPITNFALPSSQEDAAAIRELVKHHDAMLLRQHGSLTVGKTLDEALAHLERLEHTAEVFWRAQLLGEVSRLPEDVRKRLLALRSESRGRVT
jgi:L-fuculose-phosphate aldolase